MATIWSIARNLVKHGDEQRYCQLCSQLAAERLDLAVVEGNEAAARVLVSLRLSLPLSEWDSLSKSERLPFLERALALTKDDQMQGPLSPSEWAKLYKVSISTFARMRKEGRIRFRADSSKSIWIHCDDIPKPTTLR